KIFGSLLVDNDGQDAILETIGEEDIAKARADNGADTHFLQRPYRALARGAAAEIRPRDQDFRLTIGLAVKDEFRVLRAIRQIAQRAKGPLAERATHGIADQPLDADDDVGVDIGAHDRRGDGGELVERFWHVSAPSSAHRQWRRQWLLPPHSPGLPDACAP